MWQGILAHVHYLALFLSGKRLQLRGAASVLASDEYASPYSLFIRPFNRSSGTTGEHYEYAPTFARVSVILLKNIHRCTLFGPAYTKSALKWLFLIVLLEY